MGDVVVRGFRIPSPDTSLELRYKIFSYILRMECKLLAKIVMGITGEYEDL